jgi:4-amino-4-deoxy-L-arabinose transferase-like glycosyltransferase
VTDTAPLRERVTRLSTPIAGIVVALWLAAVLYGTAGGRVLPPDAMHYAIIARNLATGQGYQVDLIPFHAGLHDAIRHVPELHGLLRPVPLTLLFAVGGVDLDWVRVPGLVYMALLGFMAFVFGRAVFGPIAGALACLLTLGHFTTFWWAWSGTDDVGFALFFLCALYALHRGLEERSNGWFWLAGVAAGIALLEKLAAMFVPGVFVVAIALLARDVPRGTRMRWAAYSLAPFALALGLYLARNAIAYGGVMFRFGAYDWLLKTGGYEVAYGLYDAAPRLGPVLTEIGLGQAALISLGQVKKLALSLIYAGSFPGTDIRLIGVGLVALPLVAALRPRFAALAALALLGAIAFICGLYHVEERYFVAFVPLFAVGVGGVVARSIQGLGRGWIRLAVRGTGVAIAAVIAILTARSTLVWSNPEALAFFGHPGACVDGAIWVRENTPADTRVLSLNPWLIHWWSERPTLMIPSGRPRDVMKVARHYDAHIVFDHKTLGFPRTQIVIDGLLDTPPRGLESELLFEAPGCRVHRLTWTEGRE